MGVLAVGWMLFMFYAFPGVLSIDSFDQLSEARAGFYTDSHPPAMAVLWSIVDRFVAGGFGMLVIQGTALLVGMYLILRRACRSPRTAAVWACAVLLFPPVLAPMAVIWKDCLMAGFLVLGIGLIGDDRTWARRLGLFAFAAATMMRYNALAATLPPIVLLFEWRAGQRWFIRYAIAIGAWVGITAFALGTNVLLTDRQMHFWASSYALADIVGTLDKIEEDIPDEELRPLLAPSGILIDHDFHKTIRSKYVAADWSQLVAGDTRLWNVVLIGTMPTPEPQRDAVTRAWAELIPSHLGAYLRYRLDTFAECLGLSERFKGVTLMEHGDQLPVLVAGYGIGAGASRYQLACEHAIKWLVKKTRLFRPHVYAFLSIALLGFCRRQRDTLAILLSGLLMELSLLPLAVTPDYRYSHWMVICTCLGLVMLIARRMRPPDA